MHRLGLEIAQDGDFRVSDLMPTRKRVSVEVCQIQQLRFDDPELSLQPGHSKQHVQRCLRDGTATYAVDMSEVADWERVVLREVHAGRSSGRRKPLGRQLGNGAVE